MCLDIKLVRFFVEMDIGVEMSMSDIVNDGVNQPSPPNQYHWDDMIFSYLVRIIRLVPQGSILILCPNPPGTEGGQRYSRWAGSSQSSGSWMFWAAAYVCRWKYHEVSKVGFVRIRMSCMALDLYLKIISLKKRCKMRGIGWKVFLCILCCSNRSFRMYMYNPWNGKSPRILSPAVLEEELIDVVWGTWGWLTNIICLLWSFQLIIGTLRSF